MADNSGCQSDTISDPENTTEPKTQQAAAIDVAMPYLIKMLIAMNSRRRVAALDVPSNVGVASSGVSQKTASATKLRKLDAV